MIRVPSRSRAVGLAAMALASCGEPFVRDAPGTSVMDSEAQAGPSGGSLAKVPGTGRIKRAKAAAIEADAYGLALPLAAPAPNALFHAAYQRVEDDWEQVLFLCDSVGGDRIVLATMPNAKGLSTLWSYTKAGFRTNRMTIRLGDDDPGAGRVARAIQRSDGSAFGSIHSINPGILGIPATTTLPTLSSMSDGTGTIRCRWEPRSRVLLVDDRRSVLVAADVRGGYKYKSFDHAKPGRTINVGGGTSSTPTRTVRGGRLVRADPSGELYEFRNGDWTYRVSASADNRRPGASIAVLRKGRLVRTSLAAAYLMAAKRIE